MICGGCGAEVSHIVVNKGKERCHKCSRMSENRFTEDIMTRNRVRMESLKFEKDLLTPQVYDKATKKIVPNEEFLKANGARSKNFFKKEDLDRLGYNKLSQKIDKAVKEEKDLANQIKSEVIHHGSKEKRIEELLK